MQLDMLEAELGTLGIGMEFADRLGLVSSGGELARHRDGIVPGDAILVPDTTGVMLVESCHQCGAGGDAGWGGCVGSRESDTSDCKRIEIGRLHHRVSCDAQAVAATDRHRSAGHSVAWSMVLHPHGSVSAWAALPGCRESSVACLASYAGRDDLPIAIPADG